MICLFLLQPEQVPLDETLIVSRYIPNPLLIDGKSDFNSLIILFTGIKFMIDRQVPKFIPPLEITGDLPRGSPVTFSSYRRDTFSATILYYSVLTKNLHCIHEHKHEDCNT